MGLLISNDCWDGATASFKKLRNTIADLAGFEDYRYSGSTIIPQRQVSKIQKGLIPLLKVQLGDSEIEHKDVVLLALSIDAVIESIEGKPEPYYRFKECLLCFRNGLAVAVEKKDSIRFIHQDN